jgi:hypothetical protein
MELQDRIARILLKKHSHVLNNFQKQADGWSIDLNRQIDDGQYIEYPRVTVVFGKDHRAKLSCQIAYEHDMQVVGLQKHASLGDDEGMLFPYDTPRRVQFHMGKVRFPIDIIFVGSDGRITKKAENIKPGSPGRWGMPHTSCVIETNGGFCAKHGIEVGTEVFELVDKYAYSANGDTSSDYTMADGAQDTRIIFKSDNKRKTTAPKQAQEFYPRYPRKDVNPKQLPTNPTRDRFRDRDLVDNQVQNQPMSLRRHETEGYDVVRYHDTEEVAPVRPSP